MSATKIPYADEVWNPYVGCTPVSEGCDKCWARTLHNRRYKANVKAALAGTGESFKKGTLLDGTPPQNARAQSLDNRFDLPLPRQYDLPFSNVQLIPGRLEEPLRWRKPRTVAVCFMADLFHDQVPDEFISWVFAVMSMAPQHRFLLLTKRAERMHQYLTEMSANPDAYVWAWAHEASNVFLDGAPAPSPTEVWPLPNVWLGVSVENQARADQRIPLLLDTPGKHWVSAEPLLGAIDLSPYLGYNPVDGSADGNRGDHLRGGQGGLDRDRAGRSGLANCPTAEEPVGWQSDGTPGEGSSDRSSGRRGISTRQDHDRWQTDIHASASPSMAPLQGGHPGPADDQSQERHQTREQAEQLRAGDQLRSDAARLSDGAEGRTRSEEPELQTDRRPSGSHQNDLCGRHEDSSRTGPHIRSDVPNDLKDCTGRSPKAAGRPASGLQQSTPASQSDAQQQRPISLVVVGGESGPGYRPMELDWAKGIADQCTAARVPFYFKQIAAKRPGQPSGIPMLDIAKETP